jgi:hypothetical protein
VEARQLTLGRRPLLLGGERCCPSDDADGSFQSSAIQMGDNKEFQEIGHSGGTVTFSVKVIDGRLAYQVGWSHSRPNAAALFAVYALPQGIVVDDIALGGIGTPWNAPPIPGCFPVFVSSDSSGMFGAECPECHGYWRSRHSSLVCPYCAFQSVGRFQFLTQAQRKLRRALLRDPLQGPGVRSAGRVHHRHGFSG